MNYHNYLKTIGGEIGHHFFWSPRYYDLHHQIFIYGIESKRKSKQNKEQFQMQISEAFHYLDSIDIKKTQDMVQNSILKYLKQNQGPIEHLIWNTLIFHHYFWEDFIGNLISTFDIEYVITIPTLFFNVDSIMNIKKALSFAKNEFWRLSTLINILWPTVSWFLILSFATKTSFSFVTEV